jgi:ABC-2 type transport system permease protein
MNSAASAPSPIVRDLGLVLRQIGYEQRAYWRNRVRAFFSFAFPLMFLVIFASLDKSQHVTVDHHRLSYDVFFVPGILAYAVIATTYVNMAISTAILRDAGVLKRMQGTPLPSWAYIAARIGSTFLIMLVMTVLTVGLGVAAYGVHLRGATLPGFAITLVLGTAAFTTLGIGITRFIPNAEAAPVVVNLTVLPLTFISSVWFPVTGMPSWLQDIAKAFPIRPLADGFQYAFNPYTAGTGLRGSDIEALAIWTAIGIVLMLRALNRVARDR